MSSLFTNWVSLRKKITGLALIPALVCSIVFGLLIWASSRSTATLVGAELTRFMQDRTMRATVHGYNTSIVTYGYVMEMLDAKLEAANLLLAKAGGIRQSSHAQAWQATNQETHQATTVDAPALSLGTWQATPNAEPGTLAAMAATLGRAVILFERVDAQGDMMRVGGATTDGIHHADLGSYIPARNADDEPNRMIQSILNDVPVHGTSIEMGAWYSIACNPLREGAGEVFGMLCVGADNSSIRSLKDELAANYVGPNGSASVFFVHGPGAGRMLIEPTGISKRTEAQWLPQILQMAQRMKDNESGTVTVRDAQSGADVVVCYRYFAPWDWGLVISADSRDLGYATKSVDTQFHALLVRAFVAGFIALLCTALLALRLSQKLIDPMADLTIRLTSNATSIASSARQQAANVANINTSGNEIATAVNEISATSKELLRAMELLADDAEKTSAVATQGSRGLKGLGSSMESLSSATHGITDKLTAIRAKASKINSVVTAITKVADQTNLLSLNAAIEAEKAGEGGAGFAVVAREIRRLADQSAVATMEIEQMVEAMQEAVSSGVAQTRELTEAMDRGIQASEAISGQFSDIIQRVESMVPRYEAVHEGMQNQSEGAQQISEAMWQLTEMGRQTSESVNDLNDVSHQLHQAVRILKERIIHIRTEEKS
jgi:methyl-accepting chemotaxis protein